MDNELIDRDLARADTSDLDTRQEVRGAFTRPIERPLSGETILSRLQARFSPRSDSTRNEARFSPRSDGRDSTARNASRR